MGTIRIDDDFPAAGAGQRVAGRADSGNRDHGVVVFRAVRRLIGEVGDVGRIKWAVGIDDDIRRIQRHIVEVRTIERNDLIDRQRTTAASVVLQ